MIGVGTGRLVFVLPDAVDAMAPQRPAVLTGERPPDPLLPPACDWFIEILGGMAEEKRPGLSGK
jgi:hypothetical protein